MDKRTIEISWVSLWRILAFVAFVAVLYQGRQIMLGLFLAIVISSGLEGLINLLERIGIPRTLAVILIFLALLSIFVVLVYLVVPLLIVEVNTVFSGVAKAAPGGTNFLSGFQGSQSTSDAIGKISSQFFAGNVSPLDLFSKILGSVGLAIAVLISSFYLCIGRDGVEQFLNVVVPVDYEKQAMRIYSRSQQLIGSWFRMQAVLSVIMGFTVWAGLSLLHVPNSFLIALLAGVFELVPFLGPILSGGLGIISAFTVSTGLAVSTLIFFVIAQQFESNILVPLLSRRSVGLHPVIVIVALLIGAEIGGVLGIVISVPAAAVFQEVIQEWSMKSKRTLVEV